MSSWPPRWIERWVGAFTPCGWLGGFGLAGAPHPSAQSRFRAMVLRGPGRSTKRADNEMKAREEFLAIGCGDSAAGGSARRSSESARKAFSSKI